jgi:hypothetical protein
MTLINNDYRAILQAKSGGKEKVYGERKHDNILWPIWQSNGMLMPYTPAIQVSHAQVDYSQYNLPQTNFDYFAFSRRSSPALSITAPYTANDYEEARYMLAVIHFLRSVTMTYFGVENTKYRGLPPPVLLFSAYGPFMYEKVPVLIRNVSFGLEQDVDYVPAGGDPDDIFKDSNEPAPAMAGIDGPAVTPAVTPASDPWEFDRYIAKSFVPAVLNIFMDVVYAPIPATMRDKFDLDKFTSGEYVKDGNENGENGFI